MTSSSLRARILGRLFRRAARAATVRRARPVVQCLESRVTPTTSYPDIVMDRPFYNPLATSLPAGFDNFAPPVDGKVPAAAAPVISEWTRGAAGNHTIALTGHQFTSFGGPEAGKDADFLVYGLRSGAGATMSQADVLRLDGARAAVTLPDDLIDNKMFWVWPRNAAGGVGRPVAINQASAGWAAPDKASAGEYVSIYGENLVRSRTDKNDAKVWIEPADKSSEFFTGWADATGNPYKIDLKLPTPEGVIPLAPVCNLWVHNFHGGNSGWSPPVQVTIRAPLPTTTSSKGVFHVADYGAKPGNEIDDYVGIAAALADAKQYANTTGEGATVKFANGTYVTSQPLQLASHTNIRFEGVLDGDAPLTVLKAISEPADPGKFPVAVIYADGNVTNVHFRGLEFNDNGSLRKVGGIDPVLVRLRGSTDVTFDNCKFVANAFRMPPLDLENESRRVTIKNCDFVAGFGIDLVGASQVRVEGCDFRAVWDAEQMIYLVNSGEISVSGCTAQDDDPTAEVKDGEYKGKPDVRGFGRGRLITGQGLFNENIYIGDNTTIAFAPKFGSVGVGGKPIEVFNDGEQILFEASGGTTFGRPAAADAKSATIIGLDTNYLTLSPRLTATVIDGTGIGQRRKVTGIELKAGGIGTITVEPGWRVVPDATSQIAIAPAQQNVVIYANTLGGKPEWLDTALLHEHVASSAVQIEGVAHVLVVDNKITNVRQGVYFLPTQRGATPGDDPRPQYATHYFNSVAGNTVTRATKGVSIATYNNGAGVSSVGYGSGQLATVVRDNTFAQMRFSTAFQGTYQNFVLGVETDFQYRAADLTIFENNTYAATEDYTEAAKLTGVRTHSSTAGTTFDTIIRGNNFKALPESATGVNFAPQGTPGLFGNTWNTKSTVYAGPGVPGAVLEFPTRVVALTWDGSPGASNPPRNVTVRNAGLADPWAATDYWATADADWLIAGGMSLPPSEGANQSLSVSVNPAKIALLGNGVYTATVTVTDGAWSSSPLTVQVTVTNNGNAGPHAGVLPDLRNDRVVQIEAEHYDRGGQGVGLKTKSGGDNVVSVPGGLGVVLPAVNDSYNYTVNVPADGWYRAELRAGRGGSAKLNFGSTEALFAVPADSGWITVRPGGTTEQFVYLSYGVQVGKLTVMSGSPDFDWLRLSPVNAAGTAGLSLPYPAAVPVVSQFNNTTVGTEHYDKGGVGVAYSANWSPGGLTDFRPEEQVAVTNYGTAQQPAYAVRGKADRWVQYTVDVTTPGKYEVQFRSSNASGTATQLSLLSAGDNFVADVTVPGTGGFGNLHTASAPVTFLSTGRKSLRLRFTSGETQVAWLKFVPAELSLIGPQMPQPAAPTSQSTTVSGIKHVGTAFAVNAEATISSLRYYVNAFELAYIAQHPGASISLRLWRITSATQDQNGNVTYITGPDPVAGPVTLQLSGSQAAWFSAALPGGPLGVDPGLYMVSANVNTSYSISTIPTGATPGVLTLVAGSYGDVTSPNSHFPGYVFSSPSFPTGYFWMDVVMNPLY